MSNHVHLVLEDPEDNLAAFMKYVHERYAMRYAEKIGRTGGVFRKPFWSEPIDSERYLLCAVRYVHANPAAAGICPASAYEWSSAKDYLGRKGIADTSMVLEMLGGRQGFIAFSQPSNETALPFPGSRLQGHLSDDETKHVAAQILGNKRYATLKTMSKVEKSDVARELLDRGFSQAQLSRIMGLSRSYIQQLGTN